MPVSKYACYCRPPRLYSWSSTCCFLPSFFVGSCIYRSQFLLLFLTDGFQKYQFEKQFHTEGSVPQAKLFEYEVKGGILFQQLVSWENPPGSQAIWRPCKLEEQTSILSWEPVGFTKLISWWKRIFSFFPWSQQFFSAVGSSAARAQEQEVAGDDNAWGGQGVAVCVDGPRTWF